MKLKLHLKLITLLTIIISAQISTAQDETFETDGDWNTASNWSNSTIATGIATLSASPTLTQSEVVGSLITDTATENYTVNGAGFKLTLNGTTPLIDNNLSGTLTLDTDIDLNVLDGFILNSAFASNKLVFSPSRTITLLNKIKVKSNNDTPIEFHGTVNCNNNNLTISNGAYSANGAIEFKSTAQITNVSTLLLFEEKIVSNITTTGGFLPSGGVFKFQGTNSGGALVINGANTIEGTINGAKGEHTLYLNANQNNITQLKTVAGATLNIELDESVTEIVFNTKSLFGTTNFKNFSDNVIKIDVDLSASDLASLQIDGVSNAISQVTDSESALYRTLFDNRTASANKNELDGVSIYPNPSTEYVNISTDLNSKISILNLAGQTVYSTSAKNNTTHITVTDFTPGVYIIAIINNGKSYNSKLIIE